MTKEEELLRKIFGGQEHENPHHGETKSGKEKQLQHHLTVGALRKIISNLPDDAPVFIERIEDSYFEQGKGWQENSIFKDVERDGQHLSQFIQAYWPIVFKDDEAVYITPHY